LLLGGNIGEVWQEVDVTFNKAELHSKEFSRILQQFQTFAQVTKRHFRGGAYSLDTPQDSMGSQQHAPNFEGKLASDTFWYVYFVRQGKQWRVYRLEWALD